MSSFETADRAGRNQPASLTEPWRDPKARPYVQIERVTKTFGDFTAVDDVSLSIYQGEFFALLGGSGCGKTTLLRMLAGFEQPTSGRLLIDGIDVTDMPPYERPVNMMFQSYALFPHMSVAHNVGFGLRQDGVPRDETADRVHEALELVQLGQFAKRRPHQLSGGQRQRVALARSLIKRPKLLLLDEPLAALDKKLREETQFELVNIQEQVGITFIVVTHDQEEAMTMSTRLAVMEAGEIRQIGTPGEVYEFPRTRSVAEFIGSINMFQGNVVESRADHAVIGSEQAGCALHIDHTVALPVGTPVWVAVRPEKVTLSKEPPANGAHNTAKGEVSEIAYIGNLSIFHVRLESGATVRVTVPNVSRVAERAVTWEDIVYVSWEPHSGVVLTE